MMVMKMKVMFVVALAVFAGPAQAGLEGELGILTPGTLAGNNPATGDPWAEGDNYRFAFFTSARTTAESADISTYNTFVQNLANATTVYDIGEDEGVTWKVIGSTDAVDARDNTSTNPTVDGSGHAIFLLDGSTLIASDYADLWDGDIQHIIDLTEQGDVDTYWPWTGTYTDGTAAPGHPTSYGALGSSGQVGQGNSARADQWIWRTWTGDPPSGELQMYALSEPLVIVGPNYITPADGATVSAGNVDLRWINMDPVTPPVYVDVWFGTDPNDLTGVHYKKVVPGGADTTTVTVNAPTVGETYYWQVNSYLDGSPTGDPIEGAVHSFVTSDIPPSSVDAGINMITWSGQAVQLDAAVEDDGVSNLTYAWSADPAGGVKFSDPNVEDPNVTITKAAGDAETVTLTLAVHDADNPTPVEDTVEIDVYDDACKAGRIGKWRLADNPTDFDGNCITNLEDFAVIGRTWLHGSQLEELALMAAAWLNDYSLTTSLLNDIQLEKEMETELLSAISALKDHITGTTTLDASQIETYKWTVDSHSDIFGYNETIIAACFDLVETYDNLVGPLWVVGSPMQGGFTRSTAVNDIHWTIYNVMQYIMDETYTEKNTLRYEDLFDGFRFKSSANFPGAVNPPADPDQTHTVTINGSYLKTFGHNTMYTGSPARKPTGTYLAPGTIATVTVPPSMVGKGYTVRVGAHNWDFTGKSQVKRLDRSSLVYSINSAEVKVASPLGGGIYIEVPYLADAGIVDVQVKNAVRSPYFSAKSFHRTSLSEWQNIERNHPAPWADFQSEKFIMNVPTSWIYNFDDPVTLMEDWDAAMDAINDLMGYPHDRGKETMYPQVDVLMRANFYAPGYPSVNLKYNPNTDYGGNINNYLITGPQHAPDYLFHEEGHGYLFVKFPGEMESAVNLLHVPVWHQKFGYDLDTAFRKSRGFNNPYRTLDNTAVTWMTVFNFSPREVPMAEAEKAYQLKGHAKFVDIARLFGWEGLNAFWYSINVDYENGIFWSRHGSDIDDLILRWCESVGVDLTPLFHFWGTHPVNANALKAAIAAENLPASAEIYDTLVRYKSLVPEDNQAFQDFALNWWGKQPSINGYWTEREHARQWDDQILWDPQLLPNGEIFDESSCTRIKEVMDELIDLYFPGGRP